MGKQGWMMGNGALLILLTILLISLQLCSVETFPEVHSFLSKFKE